MQSRSRSFLVARSRLLQGEPEAVQSAGKTIKPILSTGLGTFPVESGVPQLDRPCWQGHIEQLQLLFIDPVVSVTIMTSSGCGTPPLKSAVAFADTPIEDKVSIPRNLPKNSEMFPFSETEIPLFTSPTSQSPSEGSLKYTVPSGRTHRSLTMVTTPGRSAL